MQPDRLRLLIAAGPNEAVSMSKRAFSGPTLDPHGSKTGQLLPFQPETSCWYSIRSLFWGAPR